MKTRDAYEKAFRAAIKYLEKKNGAPFSVNELLKAVYGEARTIYIAPGRTVRDWIEDLADLKYVRKVGVDKYIVSDGENFKKLLNKLYKGGGEESNEAH